jgi:hypothetical protein
MDFVREFHILRPSKLQNWILGYEGSHFTVSLPNEEILKRNFTIRN